MPFHPYVTWFSRSQSSSNDAHGHPEDGMPSSDKQWLVDYKSGDAPPEPPPTDNCDESAGEGDSSDHSKQPQSKNGKNTNSGDTAHGQAKFDCCLHVAKCFPTKIFFPKAKMYTTDSVCQTQANFEHFSFLKPGRPHDSIYPIPSHTCHLPSYLHHCLPPNHTNVDGPQLQTVFARRLIRFGSVAKPFYIGFGCLLQKTEFWHCTPHSPLPLSGDWLPSSVPQVSGDTKAPQAPWQPPPPPPMCPG